MVYLTVVSQLLVQHIVSELASNEKKLVTTNISFG